jgi:hypothetical protein
LNFNFKQIEVSFLDVFNGITPSEKAAAEAEVADDEETNSDFLMTKLKQEDCGDDVFDDNGDPVPCQVETDQGDFAVENGETTWNLVYKPDSNQNITNLANYGGFAFTWPILQWCNLSSSQELALFWKYVLNTFLSTSQSNAWGNYEYYQTS